MELQEWLPLQLSQDIWTKKYQFQGETLDHWFDRVSGGNEELKKLIIEKKFLFAGRTLANRGTGKKASFSNCYSEGYVPDSLDGIMRVATEIAMTYKSQGGQGLSLSKIRPKGTKINDEFESDGIIPFMRIFNEVTKGISQGGSRKGALLMSLDAKHKEIEDFIDIKSKEGEIEKANLSVEIDDEFMNAVDEYYKTGKIVTLKIKRNYQKSHIEYDITPIYIYKKIMQRAYDWGEPGVILTQRFRNYNLMQYVDEYQIETCNPCGEQPLPPYGACNLGSMNLSAYVKYPFTEHAEFDWNEFDKDVRIIIEGLDDVLEEGKDLHALEQQKQMAHDYRNVGLGIMGLGDMFFKHQIKYGSEESKVLLRLILHHMFRSAVFASAKLAERKGKFPKYSDKIFDSEIIKNHFTPEEILELLISGLRNCSLLSIAPSGSIGTMLNLTTGIEPAFEISYQRKTESLHKDKDIYYTVFLGTAKAYADLYNTDILPDYFVTAYNIKWKNRIDIQSIAQEYIDTAISATVNLPKETTLEEVEQLYLYAWKKRLKGVTIFRSGCKRDAILKGLNEEKFTETPEILPIPELPRGFIEDVPEGLNYRKYKLSTGCGYLYFFLGVDENDGKIYDCFCNTDGVSGCNINTQAVSRLLSAGIRGGVPIEYLIKQLDKAGICPSYQFHKGKGEKLSPGKACASSIGHVIKNVLKEFANEEYEEEIVEIKKVSNKEQPTYYKCPECNNNSLVYEGGCNSCRECGYSRCS